MRKILLIFFFFFSVIASAQESDSTDYEEPRDTLSSYRVGFEIGGGVHNSIIQLDENIIDTLNQWQSVYSPLISFGFNINFNYKNNVKLVTGLRMNITDVEYSYNIGGDFREFDDNLTWLEVPLKLKYNPGNPRKGFYGALSLNPTVDISRSADKTARVIPLKTTNISYSVGLGYLMQLGFTGFDVGIEFRHTPTNMIKLNSSFYSTNIGKLTLYSIGIYVGII